MRESSANALLSFAPPSQTTLRSLENIKNFSQTDLHELRESLGLEDDPRSLRSKVGQMKEERTLAVRRLSQVLCGYLEGEVQDTHLVTLCCHVLGALGKDAAPAEPLLIKLALREDQLGGNRRTAVSAARALADIGTSAPAAVAAVGSLISFKKDNFDSHLMYALSKMGDPGLKCAEKKILSASTEQKLQILPELVYFEDRAAPLLTKCFIISR